MKCLHKPIRLTSKRTSEFFYHNLNQHFSFSRTSLEDTVFGKYLCIAIFFDQKVSLFWIYPVFPERKTCLSEISKKNAASQSSRYQSISFTCQKIRQFKPSRMVPRNGNLRGGECQNFTFVSFVAIIKFDSVKTSGSISYINVRVNCIVIVEHVSEKTYLGHVSCIRSLTDQKKQRVLKFLIFLIINCFFLQNDWLLLIHQCINRHFFSCKNSLGW